MAERRSRLICISQSFWMILSPWEYCFTLPKHWIDSPRSQKCTSSMSYGPKVDGPCSRRANRRREADEKKGLHLLKSTDLWFHPWSSWACMERVEWIEAAPLSQKCFEVVERSEEWKSSNFSLFLVSLPSFRPRPSFSFLAIMRSNSTGSQPPSISETSKVLQNSRAFLSERLLPDLDSADKKHIKFKEERTDLINLRRALQTLLKQRSLGSESYTSREFETPANEKLDLKVSKDEKPLISLGVGDIFLQMDIMEAVEFIENRLKILDRSVAW